MAEAVLQVEVKENTYTIALAREEATTHAADVWQELTRGGVALPLPTEMTSAEIRNALGESNTPTSVDLTLEDAWADFSGGIDPISVAEPNPIIPISLNPEPPRSLFDGVAPLGAQDLVTGEMKAAVATFTAPEIPPVAVVPVQGGGYEAVLASWGNIGASAVNPLSASQVAAAEAAASSALGTSQPSEASVQVADQAMALRKSTPSAIEASQPVESTPDAAAEQSLKLGEAVSALGGGGGAGGGS